MSNRRCRCTMSPLPACVSLEGIPVSEHFVALPVTQIKLCVRIINTAVTRSALLAAAARAAEHPDRPVAAAFASVPLPAHRAHDTALVMIHGWLDNAASWDAMAPTCIRDYAASAMCERLSAAAAAQVFASSSSAASAASSSSSQPSRSQLVLYAFEMSGHGDSAHRSSTATYHPVEHALDMLQAVEALNLPPEAPCFLMGHSMGAAVATMVAQMMGPRCQGLVLMDSVGPMISSTPPAPTAAASADAPPLPDAAMLKLASSLSDTALHGNGLLSQRAPKLYPSLEAIVAKYIKGNPFMDVESARILAQRAVRRVWIKRGADGTVQQRLEPPPPAAATPDSSSAAASAASATSEQWQSGWIFKHDSRLISTHLVQATECTALRGFAQIESPVLLYLADNYRRRAVYGKGQRDPRVPTHWILAETNPQYWSLLLARLQRVRRGALVRIVEGDHHLHMDAASAVKIARDLVQWMNQVDSNALPKSSEIQSSSNVLQSKL